MRVLGIETSCDETGIAIYDGERGLLGHVLHSQISTHQPYGGVVPELAARDHVQKIIPLLQEVLAQAEVPASSITGIAYTAGPGLIGPLLIGASFAKSLGFAWGVPAIGIHHMEGHLLAPMLETPPPKFPFIALLVSGGHTMLVQVTDVGEYEILGESLDDAAGEAFDKTAKLLGLPYPGGPALAALAEQGTKGRFHFPRPLTDKPGLNFSFSGLKTFAINTLKASTSALQDKADIAYAFQEAVADTLYIKCQRALNTLHSKRLVVAGGVGANLMLREKLKKLEKEGVEIYYPRLEFCTDNGAMIAYAGYQRLKRGATANLEIIARARWPMDTLGKSD